MNSAHTNDNDALNFYAISPKTDCPHQGSLKFEEISDRLEKYTPNTPCKDCGATEENWMCLVCHEIFCSRYSNSHMVKHNETTGHHLALSFADGSFWCYTCDSYVYSKDLHNIALEFSALKFPDSTGDKIDVDTLTQGFAGAGNAKH